MKNKNFIYKQKEGFSLVETLVAITVLLIAIMAPLTLASNSLTASAVAKEQFVASFLAQEGIELIRQQRDNSMLNGDPGWLDNLKPECTNPSNCRIDFITKTIVNCNATGCIPLNYNAITKQYSYETGPDWKESIFERTIIMNDSYSEEEASVKSTVTWEVKGFSRSTVAESHLFNWQCIFSAGGC